MATSITQDDSSVLGRTAMFAGEVFIPGASEFVSGNIGGGVGTFLVAGVATALLGPTMPIVAALVGIGARVNSYQHATTGQSLFSSAKLGVDKMIHPSKSKEQVGPTEPVESKKH